MCFYSIAKYVWVIVKEVKLNGVSIYTVDEFKEHINSDDLIIQFATAVVNHTTQYLLIS